MNVKTIFTSNTQNMYQKTLYLTTTPTTTTVTNVVVTDENIYKVLADYSVIIQKLLFDFSLVYAYTLNFCFSLVVLTKI